jgi:hypothetical protein
VNPQGIERYLDELRRELGRRGILDPSFVDEAREHLLDAAEAGRRDGLAAGAEREALRRFGDAALVAEQYARQRGRMRDGILLLVATVVGIAIAYVDSRPSWDDAGVTACALLAGAALLGVAAPRRPWLWGIATGIWTVGAAVASAPASRSAGMLLILAFPLAGAYAGSLLRRFLLGARRPEVR